MFKYIIIFLLLCINLVTSGYTQIDNITYTIVGSNGDISTVNNVTYVFSNEKATVAWDACTGYEIKYDLYLRRFEWNEIVQKNLNITSTSWELIFPKSGLYIVKVRARAGLTALEIDSINGMTKEALIVWTTDYNLIQDVGDTESKTADEIRTIILQLGKASTWATSETHGTVDGAARSWWVYSYLGPPGPIIIGGHEQDGP